MPRVIAVTLKLIAVLLAPIALIGFVVARQEVTGDQYVAVLEIIGSSSQPGAIEIFGADMQTLTSILNFFQAWSLPALIAIVALGIIGLALSKDKLRATWHIFLGLFFSFGLWAVLLTRSRQAFTDFLGSEISDLSAIVIAAYLSDLSAKLLNLIGSLALLFGVLALLTWLPARRLKAQSSKPLN
jgi:hypothetical protein